MQRRFYADDANKGYISFSDAGMKGNLFYVVDANKSNMSLVDVGKTESRFSVDDATNCSSNHNY